MKLIFSIIASFEIDNGPGSVMMHIGVKNEEVRQGGNCLSMCLPTCFSKDYFARKLKSFSEANIYKTLAVFMSSACVALYYSPNIVWLSILLYTWVNKEILRSIDSTNSPRCFLAKLELDFSWLAEGQSSPCGTAMRRGGWWCKWFYLVEFKLETRTLSM